MQTGGLGALPMIGLALATGILSLGFIFRVCNGEVDDFDRKRGIQRSTSEKRSESENDSVVGNTSSPSAIVGKYEVFLSFRTKDTLKGFTSFLYDYLVNAGIRTYLDNEELRVGEEIGPEIMKAIQESKICIPILSKDYASSKWCLRELAQMVECKSSTKLNIKPIFYDVKPSDCDVNNQTGSYKKAFQQHDKDKRLDEETVQRWKKALKDVGELKGWDLQDNTNGYQGELVNIVVEAILLELRTNCMVLTDKLVGTDHHFEEMKRLLNVDSNDVRIVGIHGMGGLGKTTIAKVVYNELSECFDCCCFLANVREMSQQCSDLVNLQKQLISKIRKGKSPDIANVDEGINMIRGMACNKKVLIVLDDVDEDSRIANLVNRDWFGSGSRIIVTTRDKKVLNYFEKYGAYEPQPMKPDLALQLFSKHAFKRDFPPKDCHILSEKVVSTTGGLPLALENIGSSLFHECKEVWEGTFEKLRYRPDEKVQKELRISYDALNSDEQQIFLDIACYLIGENKTLPLYMWNDRKYDVPRAINILVHRSLVKIGDDNEFRMHDQLRDLGREIVRQENTEDPEERSRLWIYEEALDILERRMVFYRQGTKNVKALCLERNIGQHIFTKDEFGKLPNLRFLRVDCTDLTGDFKDLLSKLRWLQWRMCTGNSKPINFHLENLVILDLSHSRITENWECWSQIKMAKKLKVLILSYCKGLAKTPDLSNFVMLKGLDLCGCDKLVEVRGLTGLESLENLDMRWCTSIERLPDLSNLVMLKRLDLSACDKLVKVWGLTGLKSLEKLVMLSCESLERLIDLSNLVMLKGLHLSGWSKLVEVRSLTGLKSLENLDMSSCKSLEGLPDPLNLVMLKSLNLFGCNKLVEVRGLQGLKSLENLDMSSCKSLERLPDLSNLVMLKGLYLSGCDKLVEVRGLTGLKSLEKLDMSWCESLGRLPDPLNLVMLKSLNLSACDKLAEVRVLTGLKSLEKLDMRWCVSLERLSDLSNLVMLKRLNLSGCGKLVEVRGLTGLKSLARLNLSGCNLFEGLLDLSNLKKLKELKIRGWKNLTEIRGGEELESLTSLDISGCEAIQKGDSFAARIWENYGTKYYSGSDSDDD